MTNPNTLYATDQQPYELIHVVRRGVDRHELQKYEDAGVPPELCCQRDPVDVFARAHHAAEMATSQAAQITTEG